MIYSLFHFFATAACVCMRAVLRKMVIGSAYMHACIRMSVSGRSSDRNQKRRRRRKREAAKFSRYYRHIFQIESTRNVNMGFYYVQERSRDRYGTRGLFTLNWTEDEKHEKARLRGAITY